MKRLLVCLLTGVLLINGVGVFADESALLDAFSQTESLDAPSDASDADAESDMAPGEEELSENVPEEGEVFGEDGQTTDSLYDEIPADDSQASDDSETGENVEKILSDLTIRAVAGTDKIPAGLAEYLEGANLLKISTAYTDGTTSDLNLLKTYDGIGTWITYTYADEIIAEEVETMADGAISEESLQEDIISEAGEEADLIPAEEIPAVMTENNLHRLYRINVYDVDPASEGAEPIRTESYELILKEAPVKALAERTSLKMTVTKSKNWTIFKIKPDKTAEYGFSTNKESNVTVVLDDGETVETCKLSDSFKLSADKSYTVVLIYDMTDKIAEE